MLNRKKIHEDIPHYGTPRVTIDTQKDGECRTASSFIFVSIVKTSERDTRDYNLQNLN